MPTCPLEVSILQHDVPVPEDRIINDEMEESLEDVPEATEESQQSPKTLTASGMCQQYGTIMPTCSPELKKKMTQKKSHNLLPQN